MLQIRQHDPAADDALELRLLQPARNYSALSGPRFLKRGPVAQHRSTLSASLLLLSRTLLQSRD